MLQLRGFILPLKGSQIAYIQQNFVINPLLTYFLFFHSPRCCSFRGLRPRPWMNQYQPITMHNCNCNKHITAFVGLYFKTLVGLSRLKSHSEKKIKKMGWSVSKSLCTRLEHVECIPHVGGGGVRGCVGVQLGMHMSSLIIFSFDIRNKL